MRLISLAAAAHASSSVSRTMKCSRIPNDSLRPLRRGAALRLFQLFGDLMHGLAPGQVFIHLLGRQILAGIGRAAEIERRNRLLHRQYVQPAALYAVVFAVEVYRLAGQQPAPDGQELAGLGVAFVMRSEDAVAGQLDRIAADYNVKQQPAVAQPVKRCRLARREGRRDDAGPQRHEIFQPLRMGRQSGRCDPGILAVLAGRQQDAGKAEPVDSLGDLLEIAELRRPFLLVRTEIGAVAMGRYEPEEVERLFRRCDVFSHPDSCLAIDALI